MAASDSETNINWISQEWLYRIDSYVVKRKNKWEWPYNLYTNFNISTAYFYKDLFKNICKLTLKKKRSLAISKVNPW